MNSKQEVGKTFANWMPFPRNGPQSPASAPMEKSRTNARTSRHRSLEARTTMHRQVGKTVANWTPFFANWIQLADLCQLHFRTNQPLSPKLAKLDVGNAANLPTEPSPCRNTFSSSTEVGEISPSYYVGEGTVVPSDLRRRDSAAGDPTPRTRRVVLALDLGTTTGWALRIADGHVAHGFVSLRPQRFEGGGMRYLRFRRWLTELKATVAGTQGVGAVYFEEVRRHLGVDAAHVYGGLLAMLTAWCEHHQIPYQGVPVGTIKRHTTGKGNASKDEVISRVRALGHSVTDDNEADALALLHWAIETQED